MGERQAVARKIMERFVSDHGGKSSEIVIVGTTYQWTSSKGEIASIGWAV